MIVFFSNFINEHQIPFCEAMHKITEGEFRFVATQPFDEDRIKLGFEDKSETFPYVVKSYESEDGFQKALRLGLESDVVIIGSAPDIFIEERLKQNKLTFRYHERYFKEGRWRILDPRVFIAHYKKDIRYKKKNLYMLCASAYTAPDCRFIGCYKGKAFKWGYFPPVKRYDDIDALIKNKDYVSILWVGRFIKWKHPEAPLYVAKRLKESGYDFTLNIIGSGVLEDGIKKSIKKYGLENNVRLLGSMSPEAVREHMERSEIFLFTSDRNEGWGAVLNESMNSACAVVASGAIGSVPYLIKDGENGYVYKDGDLNDLYRKVKDLIDNNEKRVAFAKNAYKTLTDTWNAEIAAERLLTLIDNIKNGKDAPFTDGPCSKD